MKPAAVGTALRVGVRIVRLPTLTSGQDQLNGIGEQLGDPGHVTWEEHLAVPREFGRRGNVLVTYAMEELAGPNLTVDQCIELAHLGATIELCALTCLVALATRPVREIADAARTIGFERCTLATDYGQKVSVRPAEGFQTFADALLAEGLAEGAIRRTACDNPCALLRLKV